jgi:hypothetical protein
MKSFCEWVKEEFRFKGNTIGIITAYTNIDSYKEKDINEKRSKNLFSDLRGQGYDPWPFIGKFEEKKEKSFLIPNISKLDMIKLGERYNQKIVIWAKKLPDNGYSVEWLNNGNLIKKENIKNIRQLISKAKDQND